MRSSLRFFRVKISFVRFLVSSIFFQVFCSSCLRSAIRLAKSWASRSILRTKSKKAKWLAKHSESFAWGDLLLSSALDLCETGSLLLEVGLLLSHRIFVGGLGVRVVLGDRLLHAFLSVVLSVHALFH